MEVACSSERSVDFQRTTQRYIPEYSTLHNHRCENPKSYIKKKVWPVQLTQQMWFNVDISLLTYMRSSRRYGKVIGLGGLPHSAPSLPKHYSFIVPPSEPYQRFTCGPFYGPSIGTLSCFVPNPNIDIVNHHCRIFVKLGIYSVILEGKPC
jgi:hypothetical protein